ncbi:MAG TPA: hypothetical protein GX739_04635 [Firmicutes bacterium]|nr:hypothetical protein [Bacillota bacterium]
MSILTISASNTLMESLRPTIEAEFTDKTWRSEGVYTFLELPRPTGFGLDLKVVNIIATLIFRQLASIWIKRLFRVNYGYFDPEEQKQILDKAYRRLENCPHHLYHQVYAALTGYLMDNDLINLEGFIRFRAREFWQFLQETVDCAVDEYLVEREYQEFVTLLRYFVELQEPKIEMVNVIIDQPESFRILDFQGNTIQTDYLQGMLLEINYNEFDFEDFLISALITIAPARIVLHLCQGNRVEQTIISIFGTRVYICDNCSICNAFCRCP